MRDDAEELDGLDEEPEIPTVDNRELDRQAWSLWSQRPHSVNRLGEIYLPFARRLAAIRAQKNRHLSIEDFESAAFLGLSQAIAKYDPAGGAAFTTFATHRIAFSLVDEERAADHVPAKARMADREKNELPGMLPLEPDYDCAVEDNRHIGETLDDLFHRVDPVARFYGQSIAKAGIDPEALAETWGVSPDAAQRLICWSVGKLRKVAA